MNKERLLQLAEVLESDRAENHFNMRNFFSKGGSWVAIEGMRASSFLDECETAACIAGWTIVLFEDDNDRVLSSIETYAEPAQYILGLDYDTAYNLFIPTGDNILIDGVEYNEYEATPKQAAKVVRHLVETGEVDWRVAFVDTSTPSV